MAEEEEDERGVVTVDEEEFGCGGALRRELTPWAEQTLVLLRHFFLSLCQLVSSWDTKVFSLSRY